MPFLAVKNVFLYTLLMLQFSSVVIHAFNFLYPPPSVGRFLDESTKESLLRTDKRAFDRLDVSALGFDDMRTDYSPLQKLLMPRPTYARSGKQRRWAQKVQRSGSSRGRVHGFGLFGPMRLK